MGAHQESKVRSAHEETRTAEWRAEVKSGQQVARLAASWKRVAAMFTEWADLQHPVLMASHEHIDLLVIPCSIIRAVFVDPADNAYPSRMDILSTADIRENKVWITAYWHARAQSNAATDFKDHRPFIFGVMPPGTSSGFVVIRFTDLGAIHRALLMEWAKP